MVIKMRLYDICTEAKEQNVPDIEIRSVTDDTAQFLSGDVFVCITGANFDGHSVAEKMLSAGAAAVVVEQDLGLDRQILVDNTRKYFSKLASRYYGEPTKELKLIAATGTNGKSTVIALVQFILTELGEKCGSIGTVGYDVCGKVYEAHLTTPRPMDLYSYFRQMVDNGAKYCVIEASSQALAQYRFDTETFECGIFTNLSQDHLDYHGTMDKYYKAKRAMFDSCKTAIVNFDDKYGQKLVKHLGKSDSRVITYSTDDMADFFAVNVKSGSGGVSYWLSAAQMEKSLPVKLLMPGVYNVGNSMAAVATVTALGFDFLKAAEAVGKCKGVSGRSEVIYSGKFTVIRDYAHTADALLKFLVAVGGYAKRRVICVFGAAGERDAVKRPEMGEVAAKHSDYLFITSDNPRFEDPKTIIDQVVSGADRQVTPYKTFVDRREAIEAALSEAEEGDIVVLCGKGHETYQVIGDEYQPFDEKTIVAELMGVSDIGDMD